MGEKCERCKNRGKTWTGSDPQCAFPNGKEFKSDNWNCATANAIRDRINIWAPEHPLCFTTACDDERFATIDIYETGIGRALYIAWYKSRGRTDAMWVLDADEEPRRLTYAEANAIIHRLEMVLVE